MPKTRPVIHKFTRNHVLSGESHESGQNATGFQLVKKHVIKSDMLYFFEQPAVVSA